MIPVIDVPVRFRLQELLDSREPPMSQSELARRAKISFVTVNSIANNRTSQVSLNTLDALSKALGIEPGELLERAAEKRPRRKAR